MFFIRCHVSWNRLGSDILALVFHILEDLTHGALGCQAQERQALVANLYSLDVNKFVSKKRNRKPLSPFPPLASMLANNDEAQWILTQRMQRARGKIQICVNRIVLSGPCTLTEAFITLQRTLFDGLYVGQGQADKPKAVWMELRCFFPNS